MSMTDNAARQRLEELARLCGVLPSYTDVFGNVHAASEDTLYSVLPALGAEVNSPAEVEDALRERRLAQWRRPLEPVLVSWDAEPVRLTLTLPTQLLASTQRWQITLRREPEPMTGSQIDPPPIHETHHEGELAPSDVHEFTEVEGERFAKASLTIRHELPHGYHELHLKLGNLHAQAALFVAPRKCYMYERERLWGVFIPTWAVHDAQCTGGVGDFGTLKRLQQFVAEAGGHMVATLPMMPAFLEEAPLPFDPSPYMPVTRLAWNELYLDLGNLPELDACEAARHALNAAPAAANLQHLRESRYVDYAKLNEVRKAVLDQIVAWFFEKDRPHFDEFEAFVDHNPRIADYARFRAVMTQRQQRWRDWPDVLEAKDVHEPTLRYHLYAQWRAQTQMDELDAEARKHGPGLLLDMPLGVHPDGYDAWRERSYFLDRCSAGAPPDLAHKNGQDWGFAPLNPTTLREKGYRYLIHCLRFQIKNAGMLRMDHVMGLHRLWCIPQGLGGAQGVYVRYEPEEVYAILAIESHRYATMICGEDLGTVPPEVPEAMQRHEVHGLKVVQRLAVKLEPEELGNALETLPKRIVAGVNTHDMPTFAGFLKGSDLHDSEELGLLAPDQVAAGRKKRPQALQALREHLIRRGRLPADTKQLEVLPAHEFVSACLEELAASEANVVLATLEDLWEEEQPQNVPGTVLERPNWRRRSAHPLETLRTHPLVQQVLARLAAARKQINP